MVRRKTLPQVSPKVAVELRPLVTAIKEIIETGEGVRGDPLDRKLTLRDLLDSGIGKLRAGSSAGNPGALEPNPAPPNLATPPAPTGFNAVGGFDGRIDLTWTIPGSLYSNHAYTNVYRAEADNFANAILVGREAGAFYTDTVRDDAVPTPYYYWISFTSTSDIEGPLNATAGTLAQALDIDWIVDELEGKISESELANDLLTPIQAIPGIQTTLADHSGRIASTEAALSDLLNVPAYDSGEDYAVDDLVSYNGFTWRALVAMTAPAPTPSEGANWTQVGQYVTFSDIIAANAVAIDDLDIRITTAEGTLTSYGTDITALQARVTDTENDISGNSSAIDTLDSRVTTTEGSIAANSSSITLLQSGLSDTQDDVSAASAALSQLDSRVSDVEGETTANSSAITQLQTDVENLDVDGNAAALQELDTRVTANEDSITAQASDITTLTASVNGNTSAIQTKAEVSAVQGLEDDVTVLAAQYTIKLDVNGRVSGIGLANDGDTSEFIVASDAVYFIDPGQSITPFNPNTNYSSMAAARDTQLVFGYAQVEGFKRFVINVPAYIPEGYIESGMVGAISFGKITTDTGVPVTTVTGKLKADYIDVDNLAVASAATFFGDAQSGDFSSGSAGWRIQQSGTVEFNDATVRGRIEADTGYISQNLQIGGTSQDVGDLLAAADDISLFQNWIRPSTTLIDGNKIFTGDAYVDTLQIKGQAVTFPRGVSASNLISSFSSGNVLSIYAATTGAPIIVTACVEIFNSSGVSLPDFIEISVRRGGSTIFGPFRILSAFQIDQNEGGPVYSCTGSGAIQFYLPSSSSGTYYLHVARGGFLTFGVGARSLSILEAKR
ncbi:carbohydrate-binding protein [Marinobacter salarius]|uniref:carbohydrate-binding protein n=1 Tax=Marinobacter salarius TaxID=1420917 RepID=UPI003D10A635